jgi:hypothetical protein
MMTTLELEALRAELARKALAAEDEGLLKRALKLFKKEEAGTYEQLPGLTYGHEARVNELREAMADYKSGKSRGMTSEELDKDMESW